MSSIIGVNSVVLFLIMVSLHIYDIFTLLPQIQVVKGYLEQLQLGYPPTVWKLLGYHHMLLA